MSIDKKIRDKKLHYHQTKLINMNKLINTSAKNLPSDQSQMIEQAKFIYSALGKVFQKQTKTIEDQRQNKLKLYKSSNLLNNKNLY